MPALDKPLAELRQYQGINPRPDDFDAYWERALKELDATDPNPERRPSSAIQPRNAEIFDLYFDGVNGSRIYAKYIRPKSQKKVPAVLMFHGYTGSSGDWVDKMALVGQGIAVAAMDCRGQGGLSEDRSSTNGTTINGQIIRGLSDHPDKLVFRDIFLDTVQLARVVTSFDEIDADRMGCQGGSQGGALSIACAALYPGIKRCVSSYPFLSDYKRVWQMDLAENAYAELKRYFRQFDPRHEREDEIFTKLGYIDIQNLACRIKSNVLMNLTLMDRTCPPSTQFATYNKITSPKEAMIYPDFGHEATPGFMDRAFDFMLELLDE